jgi:DNA polymerase-3 subunit beta
VNPDKLKFELPEIPAKAYFTIVEAGDLCGVKPHVLRYWEQEFAQLQPLKRRGNRRYYMHHDLLLIRHIRELLYDQGYTIGGAQHKLAAETQGAQPASTATEKPVAHVPSLHESNGAMRFSVSSSMLLKHLRRVVGVIGSHLKAPILEDFLFKVERDKLTISATDLETSISTSIDVQAASDFAVSVPARILLGTLDALPEEIITFTVDKEHYGIEVTSSFGKYRLAGEEDAGLFDDPKPDAVKTAMLGSQYLLDAINKTIFVTASDGSHPAYTGVYFQLEASKLTCVATDGHRLVQVSTLQLANKVTGDFIVPKRAIEHLINTLPPDVAVELAFNEARATFSFGATHLTCKLIRATYVDYNAVIPVNSPDVMRLDRGVFLGSLHRIAIYAKKRNNLVVLDVSDKTATVSGGDPDHSNEAIEHIPCSFHGSPLRIDLNVRFLIGMVTALDSEEVELRFSNASEAMTLRPVHAAGSDCKVLMLLMPLRSVG